MSSHSSEILHGLIGAPKIQIVSSSGIMLRDAQGRDIIDASGGAAVACLGHSHPKVIEAISKQLESVSYIHGLTFSTEVLEQLAQHLSDHSPDPLNHSLFVSGGSEAVESAIKLARQFHIEANEPQRHHVIARRQSYHGNTFGALSASGHRARRELYEPMLLPFSHVDPCFFYRYGLPGESAEEYALRAANSLETEILSRGPEHVAAFLAETVVGATLGAATAEAGYFRRIREICDQYGVLLILDEVMSGLGRTGYHHAFEAEGIVPDMVTLAKGLAGGYQPIGAVLVADRIFDALDQGSRFFQHALTYSGHPVAAAAALSVQKTIVEEGLLDNVTQMGNRLKRGLTERLGEHAYVADIRGRGLLQAIEIVADRSSKQPFDPDQRIYERIRVAALENDLMVYPSPGCADGVRGDHVLLAPPYNVTAPEIDLILEKVTEAIDLGLRL